MQALFRIHFDLDIDIDDDLLDEIDYEFVENNNTEKLKCE